MLHCVAYKLKNLSHTVDTADSLQSSQPNRIVFVAVFMLPVMADAKFSRSLNVGSKWKWTLLVWTNSHILDWEGTFVFWKSTGSSGTLSNTPYRLVERIWDHLWHSLLVWSRPQRTSESRLWLDYADVKSLSDLSSCLIRLPESMQLK